MNHFPLEIFRWTDPFQTKAQYFVLQAPPFDLIAEVVCYYPFQGGDDLWSFCIKNHVSKQPIFEARAPSQHAALRRVEIALEAFVSGRENDKDCSGKKHGEDLLWEWQSNRSWRVSFQGLVLDLGKVLRLSEGGEPWRFQMYDHTHNKRLYEGSAPSENEGMRRAEIALKLFVLGRDSKEEGT